jgi:hypothetical protein
MLNKLRLQLSFQKQMNLHNHRRQYELRKKLQMVDHIYLSKYTFHQE